jgi:hypothetical protein
MRQSVGLVLALVVAATSPASGAPRSVKASCPASRVHYERLPGVEPALASLPWVAPEPRSAGLVGHLFYYSALRWGRSRVRDFRIYSGGSAPSGRLRMKILWSAPERLEGRTLVVRGTRLGRPGRFVRTLAVGPSIVNVPSPGCWRLTLKAGGVATRLTVLALRGAARH